MLDLKKLSIVWVAMCIASSISIALCISFRKDISMVGLCSCVDLCIATTLLGAFILIGKTIISTERNIDSSRLSMKQRVQIAYELVTNDLHLFFREAEAEGDEEERYESVTAFGNFVITKDKDGWHLYDPIGRETKTIEDMEEGEELAETKFSKALGDCFRISID